MTDDGEYKYYYDCENQLTDVNTIIDEKVASYKYDYLGRRISKTLHASQKTIHYTYSGSQIIAEYENGSLARKYIYGTGIDEPICMIDVPGGNAIYYYHFDGLGSVVALSNNNGNVLEKYSYDVFGTVTILSPSNEPRATSSVGNAYMFTGREYDTETGNYYYRARYYKPSIGRFLQPDPIGYFDSMNLYAYVGNNPIMWIDPWGLCRDKKPPPKLPGWLEGLLHLLGYATPGGEAVGAGAAAAESAGAINERAKRNADMDFANFGPGNEGELTHTPYVREPNGAYKYKENFNSKNNNSTPKTPKPKSP